MTREEFKKVLEEKGYSYEIKGDKIVVTCWNWDVDLSSLETLPPDVEFRNGCNVYLYSLETLPPGVQFENGRYVDLRSLTSLPPGVQFRNRGIVDLRSLETLPPGVEFNNRGDVYLPSLIGGGFYEWKGNIKGIDSKRLFNFMISKGFFI